MAYDPLVYRTSGGDEQVVSTGGRLLISGTLQLTTGATLTLAGQSVTSTGAVTSRNFVNNTIAAASSGSTGLVSYGISQVWSSGTSTGHVFTMPAAASAGVEKWIMCTASTSTAPAVISLAGTLIDGNATITFTSGSAGVPQWIHLMAENTTNWFVVGMSTGALSIA